MYRVAHLTPEEEVRVKRLERELGVTLIAYSDEVTTSDVESIMNQHNNNNTH